MSTEQEPIDISLSSKLKSIFRTLCLDILDTEVRDGWNRYYLTTGAATLTEVRTSVKKPHRVEVHPRALITGDVPVALPPYEWNGSDPLEEWIEEAVDVGTYVAEVFAGTIDEVESFIINESTSPAILRGEPVMTRNEAGVPYIISFTRGDTGVNFRTDFLVAVRDNKICSEAKTRVLNDDTSLGEVVYEGRQRGHDTIPVIMSRISNLLKNTVKRTEDFVPTNRPFSYDLLVEMPGVFGDNVVPFPCPFRPKALLEGS